MQTIKNLMLAVLAMLGLSLTQTARGGPPFVTDDPEPVDYHHWEVFIASEHAKLGGDWSGTLPHFEFNYGPLPDVQTAITIPLAYDVPPSGSSHYGIGDIELGLKYRFIHETNGWPQISFYPLLELPSGSVTNNLGTGNLQAFLPFWAQKSWGPWTAYGGGGYGINSLSGHENWNFVGAVLEKQVRTNLLIGAELYHQSGYQSDFPNSGTAFNLGAVFDFSEHHHLLFAAGRSISGPVEFQCYLAWQFTFGNSELAFWRHPRD